MERRGDHPRVLPGALAFELYDTYGFPLDLQEVIGKEQGFDVDGAGFEQELERARERSAGSKVGEAAVEAVYKELAQGLSPVEFLGYDAERATGKVVALLRGGQRVARLEAGEAGELVTDRTPFYAESGGQVGDRGEIQLDGGARFAVDDTVRPRDGLMVHRGRMTRGSLELGATVALLVDGPLRAATRRNHSATHLLHWALRKVVGPHAMQKGSLVGPDRLRFDYSAAQALSPAEIEAIEELVNQRVLQNAEATTDVLPMAEAKRRGAIGIFEEKYGEVVRMLTMTDSIELCGGTHVRRTGDIGSFKVLSDAGIAAGVRRIEAVTGLNALRYTQQLERDVTTAAALLRGGPRELVDKVQRAVERQREQQKEIEQLKRKLTSGGSRDLAADAQEIGGMRVLAAQVDVSDAKAMRELADTLRDKLAPAVVALGAPTPDGRVVLVCTVSKDLTARLRAGDVIKELAAIVGGGGGGRPDFAQAGGSDPGKLPQALSRLYELARAV
jgi:alanyl-tRNA synthetase